MDTYTALDDPIVDQTIEKHLGQIVEAVRSRMEPQSILLRGSFARGEGSVAIQDGRLHFLSDYEIDVVSVSPFYSSLFAKLSCQLTSELGVETSLRRVRPDFLYTNCIGPFPIGLANVTTIALFESRYGSRTIYGENFIDSSPPIDASQILLGSGIRLVLNRMAESLYYIPKANDSELDNLQSYYWVSKTILACAESLLLLWGQYHYSYEERKNRFVAMAPDRLTFMNDQLTVLSALVERATEFKLCPKYGLYHDSVRETWLQVIPVCSSVFRYLTHQILGLSFSDYVEFPEQFIQHATDNFKSLSPLSFWSLKLLEVYRYLRAYRLPRGVLLPYTALKVVYAITPLVFVGWASQVEELPTMLREARRWLQLISPLELPEPDPWNEWNALRQRLLWAWRVFCY